MRVLISFLYCYIAITGSFNSQVSEKDHSKVIHFLREKSTPIKKVPYVHKAIVYVPRVSLEIGPTRDSSGHPLNPNGIYVIHLWTPLPDKRKSYVRIDPIEDVIMGDQYEVIPDSAFALPPDLVIKRALSRIGYFHRDRKYNLVFNNCGNFVYWAKEGRSDRDTQFWDKLDDMFRKIGGKPARNLKSLFRGLVERRTNRLYPDF